MGKGNDSLVVLLAIIVLVSILHLVRAFMGWTFIIEGFVIPIWLSYLAFIVLGFLSYKLFTHLKNKRR
jgi:hypothetical protein|tara:strand:- start:331 stop:534 length:204 start_codon:yes stop_codon:yes gene_type:complete